MEGRYNRFEAVRLGQEAYLAGSEPGSQVLDEAKVFRALETSVAGLPPGVQVEARTILKARIADFNEVRKTKTASVFATALQAFQAPGKDGKPRNRVAFIPPEVVYYLRIPRTGRRRRTSGSRCSTRSGRTSAGTGRCGAFRRSRIIGPTPRS